MASVNNTTAEGKSNELLYNHDLRIFEKLCVQGIKLILYVQKVPIAVTMTIVDNILLFTNKDYKMKDQATVFQRINVRHIAYVLNGTEPNQFTFKPGKTIGLEVEMVDGVLRCTKVQAKHQAAVYKDVLLGAEIYGVNNNKISTLEEFRYIAVNTVSKKEDNLVISAYTRRHNSLLENYDVIISITTSEGDVIDIEASDRAERDSIAAGIRSFMIK